MKVYFEFKGYVGVYSEETGFLTVTNVFTNDEFTTTYANKYTAKRGFKRIVSEMRAKEV